MFDKGDVMVGCRTVSKDKIISNGQLIRIWKELIVVYFTMDGIFLKIPKSHK
jgi:hypothetical protein